MSVYSYEFKYKKLANHLIDSLVIENSPINVSYDQFFFGKSIGRKMKWNVQICILGNVI